MWQILLAYCVSSLFQQGTYTYTWRKMGIIFFSFTLVRLLYAGSLAINDSIGAS